MIDQQCINYVRYLQERIGNAKNKGFAAKLKRADNEATEYQSWEILADWVDLSSEVHRKAYQLIGASIARTGRTQDDITSLGKALNRLFFKDGNSGEIEKSPASARLRRVLACRDVLELIDVLRPILRLLDSKEISYSYARLLDEIIRFNHDSSRDVIRSRWAQDFFRSKEE